MSQFDNYMPLKESPLSSRSYALPSKSSIFNREKMRGEYSFDGGDYSSRLPKNYQTSLATGVYDGSSSC